MKRVRDGQSTNMQFPDLKSIVQKIVTRGYNFNPNHVFKEKK